MFISPVTGERLIKARAGGATIWYCPSSDGRMLNLEMARHFFGPDKTREIWMRSDGASITSQYECPCCRKIMREAQLPDWVGEGTIDVCRTCRIFWLEPGEHPQVPLGSQLIHPQGDSTLVKDLGEAYLDHQKNKAKIEAKQNSVETQPQSTVEALITFLGLPVERTDRHRPEWTVISGLLIVGMIFFHWLYMTPELVTEYGFYPSQFFKNAGLNIFISPFIHGGWMHLIFNLYFAYILCDDVEEDMGWKKFIFFHFFVILLSALMENILSGHKDIPHIGYSGVVMALFAYYGFQFPKSKLVWMFPGYKIFGIGMFKTAILGVRWYQVRVLWVAFFYFIGDVVRYFILEKNGLYNVSYSGHIAGFVSGYLFWKLFAVKSFNRNERDVFDSYMDRLVAKSESLKLPSKK